MPLTRPASAPSSTTQTTCACGCGLRLSSGMTVVWVDQRAYGQGCVSVGPFDAPAKALRGVRA